MSSATAQVVQDVLDTMLLLCDCGAVATASRGLCAECDARENPRCRECGELFRESDYDEFGKQNGDLCGSCEIAEEAQIEAIGWRRMRERRRLCH